MTETQTPIITRETVRGKGRVYSNSLTGQQFPSVTTILGALDKPALPRWASKMVATYVVDNGLDPIATMERGQAIRHLSGVPWASSQGAADIGTAVHEAAEAMLRGQEHEFMYPHSDEARNAMGNVRGLLSSLGSRLEPIVLEGTVWNQEHEYAGAFDGIGILDGAPVLFDWKTSSGIWPEMALQLAAYRNGGQIIDTQTGELFAMPRIEQCLIFHVPKTGGWGIHELDAEGPEFECFLAARAAHAWSKTPKRKATILAHGDPA